MLLPQALRKPLRIYLNVIITLYIFSDDLIYANILEDFNLMLEQLQCANTLAWRSTFCCNLYYLLFLSSMLNKEMQYNTTQVH